MLDKELIRKRVIEFQQKEIPDETINVDKEVDKIIRNCLPEFEQNVVEWCNYQPLTEVKFINDWSLKKLYEVFPDSCFSYLLNVAKCCKEYNCDDVISFFTIDIVI